MTAPTQAATRRSQPNGKCIRVTHIMWRLSKGGGVQVVVRRLAAGLSPDRFDIHVVTARPDLADDSLSELPVKVHPLGHTGPTTGLLRRIGIGIRLAHEVAHTHPDVVHCHGGAPWQWVPARFRLPRTPLVLEVHDAPGSGRHSAATDRIEGTLVRWFRVPVVCHSTSVADEIIRLWRLKPTQVLTFPLAVDTERFEPSSPDSRLAWRQRNGIDASWFVLVGVGRFAPSKRFELAIGLVGAMNRRGHRAHLVLVGDGGEAPALRALADESPGAVTFTGPLYDDDLAACLGACDLLCSLSEYEGFGLTLIEAMACGTPIAAIPIGGVTDILVEGINGIALTGQVDIDAESVADLLGDTARTTEMAARGLALARSAFSLATFSGNFGAVYESLAIAERHAT